jgi:hypothetical protein
VFESRVFGIGSKEYLGSKQKIPQQQEQKLSQVV